MLAEEQKMVYIRRTDFLYKRKLLAEEQKMVYIRRTDFCIRIDVRRQKMVFIRKEECNDL